MASLIRRFIGAIRGRPAEGDLMADNPKAFPDANPDAGLHARSRSISVPNPRICASVGFVLI